MSSSDIAGKSSAAKLGSVLITKYGNAMTSLILPSVQRPLDGAIVAVEYVVTHSYSTVEKNWVTQDFELEAGKR